MEILLRSLNEGQYHYRYENDTLSFLDERINDIMLSNYNSKLYNEIRKAKFRVLDLSALNNAPKEICGFEFIEEIRMPILRSVIPEIKKCPRLKTVIFDSKTITRLCENSFRGWPKLRNVSFGIQLKEAECFCLSGEIDTVDFSECSNLSLREHAFQRSRVRHIILPTNIKSFVDYLFFDCQNLETIIAKGVVDVKYNSFGDVANLKSIKISPQYNKDSFFKSLRYGLFHRKFKTGILIDSDEQFSYFWSITDFKFYYSYKLAYKDNEDFIGFYIDSKKELKFGEDTVLIDDESNTFCISEFEEGKLVLSDRYTKQRKEGVYILAPENLQRNAIDSFRKIKELLGTDIREVINKIGDTVQNLNIDSIIDSYKTTIDEYTITKVGDDDRFYSTIITQASYTDDYIETLLPSRHSNYRDSGYTTNWPWTTKEKMEEYEHKDFEIRNNAKTTYSSNDHITFLIKKYLDRLLHMEVEIEQYLHINRAQEIASEYRYLNGLNRVLMLNSIPI